MDKQLAQHRTQEQGSRIAAAAHLNYEFAMYRPGAEGIELARAMLAAMGITQEHLRSNDGLN